MCLCVLLCLCVTNNRLEGNCRGPQWLWAGPRHHPSIWRWGWIQFDIPVCLCLHHYGLKLAGSDRLRGQVAWCRRGMPKLYFRVRCWCKPWTPCKISFLFVCSKLRLRGQMAELVGRNGNVICAAHNIARCYAAYMSVRVKISAVWTLHVPLGWWIWLHFPLMFGSPGQLLSKPQLPACLGRQTPLCCFSVVVLKSTGSKGASSVLCWDVYYGEANATWSN